MRDESLFQSQVSTRLGRRKRTEPSWVPAMHERKVHRAETSSLFAICYYHTPLLVLLADFKARANGVIHQMEREYIQFFLSSLDDRRAPEDISKKIKLHKLLPI